MYLVVDGNPAVLFYAQLFLEDASKVKMTTGFFFSFYFSWRGGQRGLLFVSACFNAPPPLPISLLINVDLSLRLSLVVIYSLPNASLSFPVSPSSSLFSIILFYTK